MDPDETLKALLEALDHTNMKEAEEYARALREWLINKGGYMPQFERKHLCELLMGLAVVAASQQRLVAKVKDLSEP